jgi:hypothetical protein
MHWDGWQMPFPHKIVRVHSSHHQNTKRVREERAAACCNMTTMPNNDAYSIAPADEPLAGFRRRRRRVPNLQSTLFLWLPHVLLVLVLLPGTTTVLVVRAAPVMPGLSDPNRQPKFQVELPNPLAPSFLYDTTSSSSVTVSAGPGWAATGLVGRDGATPVITPIWGYGTRDTDHTWPGRTFQVQSYAPIQVRWVNRLRIADGYLLTGINNSAGNYAGRSVVDTSIHYCYSIPGYTDYTIETHGTPIVPHLHGGHSDAAFDGNSESFFTPRFEVTGPQWPGEVYEYDNSQPATSLWYHDHALGLTRYVPY